MYCTHVWYLYYMCGLNYTVDIKCPIFIRLYSKSVLMYSAQT